MKNVKQFNLLCEEGLTSGPASVGAIAQAEADLGVFPEEYRGFLERYGALVGEGFQIYGLPPPSGDEQPLWQDVVSVNRELKKIAQAGSEKSGFIAISDNGMGVYFFLNTSELPKASVWAIGPGVDKKIASGFKEFFENFWDYDGVI